MRVLIADDSAFMRKILTDLFESGRGFEVVGTARNGADAVTKVRDLNPDIVTMDVEMPEMNGLSALRKIRAEHGRGKPAVLMCSTLTQSGSDIALESLRAGAADVIAKESLGLGQDTSAFRNELLLKVRAIGMHVLRTNRPAVAAPATAAKTPKFVGGDVRTAGIDAVVIGSSTGGPPVLETIVESLESVPTRPIMIAQHMPSLFTKSLANRMNDIGPARVKLAADGESPEAGTVYIAEGGLHLRLLQRRGRVVFEVSVEPAEALYKPSVTELFSSAASVYGKKVMGVMLTGMGDDGLIGARKMHDAGAQILAQSEDSCVVYGMPRAVVEAGITSDATGIEELCGYINQASGCRSTPKTGDESSLRRSA